MTPTESDKAAAEAIVKLAPRPVLDLMILGNVSDGIAGIISQYMAPERSAAAAVKAELEEARKEIERLKTPVDTFDPRRGYEQGW